LRPNTEGLVEGKPAYESHQILLEDVILEINGVAVMHMTFDKIMLTFAQAGVEVEIKVATDWDVSRAQEVHDASPMVVARSVGRSHGPGKVSPPGSVAPKSLYAGKFWGGEDDGADQASVPSPGDGTEGVGGAASDMLNASSLSTPGVDDAFNISGVYTLDDSTMLDLSMTSLSPSTPSPSKRVGNVLDGMYFQQTTTADTEGEQNGNNWNNINGDNDINDINDGAGAGAGTDGNPYSLDNMTAGLVLEKSTTTAHGEMAPKDTDTAATTTELDGNAAGTEQMPPVVFTAAGLEARHSLLWHPCLQPSSLATSCRQCLQPSGWRHRPSRCDKIAVSH
jgi:hypothetical protein